MKTKSPTMKFSRLTMIVGFSIFALAVLFFLWIFLQQRFQPFSPAPQTPKKIGVIQWVKVVDDSYEGFKEKLTELGYEEGKDVIYEYQNANADQESLKRIASSFVEGDVDLIYAITFPSTKVALEATRNAGRQDIPVVFAHASNPLEGGVIEGYKSSGNNLAGVMADIASLTPKKLEIFKRINPNITRVGFFDVKGDTVPSRALTVAALREHAPKFGITLVEYPIQNQAGPEFIAEVQRVADSIKPGDVDAMLHPPGVIDSRDTQRIDAELGRRLKIPVTFVTPQTLDVGGVFVYAHSFYAVGEQAAVIADKILKGAKPDEIPIETPIKNIITVSRKNAEEIDLQIPPDLLEIAERWGE